MVINEGAHLILCTIIASVLGTNLKTATPSQHCVISHLWTLFAQVEDSVTRFRFSCRMFLIINKWTWTRVHAQRHRLEEGRCPQVGTSSSGHITANSPAQRSQCVQNKHTLTAPVSAALTKRKKRGAGTFGNSETGKLDLSWSSEEKWTDYHHVQLGETGARWPQQGRRDVPDGDGRTADPLHQEAAAAGGDLPLPWLPLSGFGARRLPEQTYGAAGRSVFNREDHLHQVRNSLDNS